MFIIKKLLFVTILVSVFFPFFAFQDAKIQDKIIYCFETGNSKYLSRYFNQNVDLTVPGNKNVYSKAQAQQILGRFFSKNVPKGFKIITNTPENDGQNIIGLLKTSNTTFRIYILIKKTNGKSYIHLLKIERRQN